MYSHLFGLVESCSKNPSLKVWVVSNICKTIRGIMIGVGDSQFVANFALLRIKTFVLRPLISTFPSSKYRIYDHGSLSWRGPGILKHVLVLNLFWLHPFSTCSSSQLGARFGISCQFCHSIPRKCSRPRLMLPRKTVN